MMYELFVRVIDMSITASVVMIAVFIARGAMGKLPKRYSYLLWAIVAVRLLCPMGISSSFSVFNLFGERNVQPAELQRDSARGWGGEWRNDGSSSLMGDYASQGRAEEANGSREPAESETRIKPVGASRADMESQSQKVVSDVEEGDFQKVIAFGESNARRRVKHIMKYEKCGKWIGMIAIGAVLVVGVACLTDARRGEADDDNKAETASTQKPGTWDLSEESQYPAVASVSIDGYQLEVQCATDEKKPKSGNYEGDSLVIQTSRDEKVIDRREVSFGKGKKVYFPAKGIELSLADYDGDGRKNDFALGQGQGADPVLGNYMNYRFFGLDADGTILEYGTSSEDGVSIRTVPGKYSPLYSPLFKRKNGELIYEGLGGRGGRRYVRHDCKTYFGV